MRVMVMWHENARTTQSCDPLFTMLRPVMEAGDEFLVKGVGFPLAGPTSYISWSDEHLARYEPWFPGLTVRVRARLATRPLGDMEALYLPVTYNSWCVVIADPQSLPTALEAASRLRTGTAVCPFFSVEDEKCRLARSPSYTSWHDRVKPGEA